MTFVLQSTVLRQHGWTPDYASLQKKDWTFRNAYTQDGPHGIHPYPAKFIPQIPRELIADLHPGDDSAILDPFCGSGTTLVEAARAGIPSVGIDLHPLACLISKVKVTPLGEDLRALAESVVERASASAMEPPNIPALDHWFARDIQIALSGMVHAINAVPRVDERDALRVALSSIIVRVSRQESDTRYAAIDNSLRGADVGRLFLLAAANLAAALDETWGSLPCRGEAVVINKNILATRPDDIPKPVSLVVSSPPYPNAYEYWLYHKYRMYWLGMDPIAVRRNEIGARPHYHKRNPQTAADFEVQIGQLFDLLSSVIVPRGHACFQVGSSIIRGEHIDNAKIFERAATSRGFSLVAAMTREIPRARKAFNLSHARINEERILIFRRDGR